MNVYLKKYTTQIYGGVTNIRNNGRYTRIFYVDADGEENFDDIDNENIVSMETNDVGKSDAK